jgi:hypothetical protein
MLGVDDGILCLANEIEEKNKDLSKLPVYITRVDL